MDQGLARQTGSALLWNAVQLAALKGIFLLRLLILARLLSPEEFGLVAIATVVIGVFISLTDFGMVPALVQSAARGDELYHVAWTVGVARAVTIATVVVVGAPYIAALFGEPRATAVLQVLALRPLIDSLTSIKVADLTRSLQFRSLTFIKLPEGLINTVVAISTAHWLGVWSLVVGALAGSAASVIMSYVIAPYRPRINLGRAAAKRLMRYGQWVFATGVVVVLGNAFFQVVISRQLGVVELGLYSLAARLAFLPYEVASGVLGSVAFPVYAHLQSDTQQLSRAFQSFLIVSATLLVPVYFLMIALAPAIVIHVLGTQWTGATTIFQVLAVAGLFGLLGDTVTPLLKGTGQPDRITLLEVVQSATLITLVWALTGPYGLLGATAARLLSTASSQLLSVVFVRRILQQTLAGTGIPLLAVALASLAGATAAFIFQAAVSGFVGLVVACIGGVLLAAGLLWVLDRYLHLGLLAMVPKVFPAAARLLPVGPAMR